MFVVRNMLCKLTGLKRGIDFPGKMGDAIRQSLLLGFRQQGCYCATFAPLLWAPDIEERCRPGLNIPTIVSPMGRGGARSPPDCAAAAPDGPNFFRPACV